MTELTSPLAALERSTDLAAAEHTTLERLAARMVWREYPAGATILAEGDPSGPGYLVVSGSVRLSSARSDRRQQTLARIGPGELVGEMTALLDRARTATATALEPVSAWEIPAEALRAAFRDDLRLAYSMLLTVMELLVDRDVRVVRRLGLPPVQQLAAVILDRLTTEGIGEGEPLPMTAAELEVLTGESQVACVMNLARLRRGGAIETAGDDRWMVVSMERLQRFAE